MAVSIACFGAGKLFRQAKIALQGSKKAIDGAKNTI
jgi:hypothetical protein